MKLLFIIALLSTGTQALADSGSDIAAQEARISALQKEVAPLAAPLQNVKSDLRVFASLDPIIAAVSALNSLPSASRIVSFQSTGANGHFYENNGLCNSYVELQGPADLNASGELTAFSAATQDDGSLLFAANANTNGHLQAHWQFLGVRVPGPLGFGNVCPPGGGVGGSIGASFQKGLSFKVRIEFVLAADGRSVSYQASVIDPRNIDVTISLGLQHLGNVGFPVSFKVPVGPIASGQFALLIGSDGKFIMPGEKAPREYSLTLRPASFTATKAGVKVEWTSTIDFKNPTASL